MTVGIKRANGAATVDCPFCHRLGAEEMIKSAEEFRKLRTSGRPEEYARAANESAPITVWKEVIARFPELREWVVHNKTVPVKILELLSKDPDSRIRAKVADKRKLSLELFNVLSRDPDEVVRQRIACNKKIPMTILKQLATDDVALVREAAHKSLKLRSLRAKRA